LAKQKIGKKLAKFFVKLQNFKTMVKLWQNQDLVKTLAKIWLNLNKTLGKIKLFKN